MHTNRVVTLNAHFFLNQCEETVMGEHGKTESDIGRKKKESLQHDVYNWLEKEKEKAKSYHRNKHNSCSRGLVRSQVKLKVGVKPFF